MPGKYKKKQKLDGGKSKQRRYRKSKYGRGDRASRKANRDASRTKIVVPRDAIAPAKCFIKVTAQERFPLSNASNDAIVNVQLLGNGLDSIWTPDTGVTYDTRLDKKLKYYERIYNRYYCYASRIKARFFQGWANATDAVPQIPCYLYAIPINGALPIVEQNIGFKNNTDQARPDMWPQSKVKYIEGIRFGRGPTTINHKMATKTMFQKNTKTDDDYCGSIEVDDASNSIAIANPAGGDRWYWNIGAGLVTKDESDTIAPATLNMWVLITVEYYVMLYMKDTIADTVKTT